MVPIKPLHILLSALSAAYSKLFSLYFKFSGEPWVDALVECGGDNNLSQGIFVESGIEASYSLTKS